MHSPIIMADAKEKVNAIFPYMFSRGLDDTPVVSI